MYNTIKLFIFASLLVLSACGDKDAGEEMPAKSGSSASADAMEADTMTDKALPAEAIETPQWAELEQTVISY